MPPILPFFFTALSVFTGEDGATEAHVETNRPYYAIEAKDTVHHTGMVDIATFEVIAEDNAVRRYAATADTAGHTLSVTDAGAAEMKGMIDDLYVTDADGNTVDIVFNIADAAPTFAPLPEGGLSMTLTDHITASTSSNAEAEYILRYTSVTKRIDENGHITLLSIRPTTDDLDAFACKYRVYYRRATDDILMDAATLRNYLRTAFPIPRR